MEENGKRPAFAIEPTAPSEEPSRLPAAPGSSSRVDTLSEDFLKLLSRRPFASGDVIANRYRLLETLGEGGMGQVFVAENLSIGRRVAVKMLKAELLADATFRRRFQQESQAIAAIEHRNVARFFDLVVGDPTFLVMEYVPGPTLAYVIRQKSLDAAKAINIARRLCWALDAAHQAGVIHRDIKPSNIILQPDTESGLEPKLIDFGLAKLASATSGEGLTRIGQIIGTPSYMSPEQIANQDVDARSDVYSLGCVLYEMLTGAAPFAGMEDVQVLYKQLHENPPAPSSRVPSLPPEIDAVVARSMAKEPAARFASMQEMATALAKIDRRRNRETNLTTEPRMAMGRPAYGLALAAFVVGALSAGGGVWFGSQQRVSGGAILVSSRPAGASVEVDGRKWHETTPTAVTALAPGRHVLRIQADGHGAVDQTVILERAGRASIEVALPALTRAMAVQTVPAGAMVFVDGHLQEGRSPLMVQIGSDDFHELRVELDGFETETRAVKPEDHDPTTMIALEPAKQERGTLWVDGPPTSEVYLDGAPVAPAPTIGLQVSTGSHNVELRSQDGTALAHQDIAIKRGQTVHVAPLDVAKLSR